MLKPDGQSAAGPELFRNGGKSEPDSWFLPAEDWKDSAGTDPVLPAVFSIPAGILHAGKERVSVHWKVF